MTDNLIDAFGFLSEKDKKEKRMVELKKVAEKHYDAISSDFKRSVLDDKKFESPEHLTMASVAHINYSYATLAATLELIVDKFNERLDALERIAKG